MDITLEFFGVLERLAGARRHPLALGPAEPTVAEALAQLARERPELAAPLERCAVAIGDALVDRRQRLAPGTTLALLPPVAGG